MRDSLPAMAVFAQVVEDGGFTAAARRLGLAKSSVSKQVAQLEDRLGVRLLERTTRRIRLTEAGERYFERCRRIVAEATAAEAEVGKARAAPSGLLRLSAPASFGIRRLPDPLVQFMKAYPDVEVALTLNDRQVDLVEEGYDLALRIGALRDSSLMARRLAPVAMATAAAPAYLATHGRPETPSDLTDHACLGYAYLDDGRVWTFKGPAGVIRRRFRPRLLANNGDVLRAAAGAGLGIVHMPRFLLDDALANGALETILDAFQPPELGLYAVYPAGRPLPAKTRSFIDFTVRWFAEDDAIRA